MVTSSIIPLSLHYLLSNVAKVSLDFSDQSAAPAQQHSPPSPSSSELLGLVLVFVYSIQRSKLPPSTLKRLNLYPRRLVKSNQLIASLTSLDMTKSDGDSPLQSSCSSQVIPYNSTLVSTIINLFIASNARLQQADLTQLYILQAGFQILQELCGTGFKNTQPLDADHMSLLTAVCDKCRIDLGEMTDPTNSNIMAMMLALDREFRSRKGN